MRPVILIRGQDAMVSFDGYAGPDLKFVNTQNTSIGLRASFDGKQLKLSIVGLPCWKRMNVFPCAQKRSGELEPPAPVYEENLSWLMGEER